MEMRKVRSLGKPRPPAVGTLALIAGGLILGLSAWIAYAAIESERLNSDSAAVSRQTEPAVSFGRDIRPILSDRCFTCHGPDDNARMADLRLDIRDSAIAERDGVTAIVPGHPDKSELLLRVSSDDPHVRMPPPETRKPAFTDEEVEAFRRWIAAGAEYENHWSFVPPKRPEVPAVTDAEWCRNPIDRFILHRLEQDNTRPSSEADRETLIRRLFLDLTGLPPTPEEIDAFLADDRPDAYERWVDKLLTVEPYRTRYAERMAVPWLDAARYADTCGIHTDAGRQIWLWRDWVLNAFRDNMPFDQFVIEQLAGDLLPDATIEQKIASGFNRNHVTTDEGGAINEEYLVEYAVDRTNTTGAVFLGLTMLCARCHDHKYDPISQKDYYGLYAFFNSNDEPGLYSQLPDPQRAHEPFLVVPTDEQKRELGELTSRIEELEAEIQKESPAEKQEREAFLASTRETFGLNWQRPGVVSAESTGGATLKIQDDGSVLASGANPARDEHVITLRTNDAELQMLLLEALADPSLPKGRVGRAVNGNAVLSGIEATAVSVADDSRKRAVRFVWAWADVEQANGDHRVVNILDSKSELGWAVDGHNVEGNRVAMLLAEEPFGFEGGTELRIRLLYNSIYGQHTFGRVRFQVSPVRQDAFDALPAAVSGWYVVGPFPAESPEQAYETSFGPEQDTRLDLAHNFGTGNQYWSYNPSFLDATVNNLANGVNATYVGRRILSPTARIVSLSLGSDDGFALFVNGKEVASKQVARAVAPDQDPAEIELNADANTVVLKIVNVAGPGGFYYRAKSRDHELAGDLAAALLPGEALSPALATRFHQSWRVERSPGYLAARDALAAAKKRKEEIDAAAPRTMIMKELPEQRETFVLKRGEYDKPDKSRPVTRSVPGVLGTLPEDAPKNRLGLAQWLVSKENPLVSRVTVNRLWQQLFGRGIVGTPEDFGFQGEWPTHPELLDWLAVEFRENGWDMRHIIRLIVTSSTYRQHSRIRKELRDEDPDNRLLASFPRRRLDAEFIRDQALHLSGLLVEELGGPSVKPYQPEGLWREVAMKQSNTRIFERGEGEALYRRSLYTYWKRACPPPSLMMFDAPTREACVIHRSRTNTPLQALVLWNDEQFVEAARVLAERVIFMAEDDRDRIVYLFRSCTGRLPEDAELGRIRETLAGFRERYQAAPDDARALIDVGEAPVPEEADAPELAAWTMIANALLNLSETITQH